MKQVLSQQEIDSLLKALNTGEIDPAYERLNESNNRKSGNKESNKEIED